MNKNIGFQMEIPVFLIACRGQCLATGIYDSHMLLVMNLESDINSAIFAFFLLYCWFP